MTALHRNVERTFALIEEHGALSIKELTEMSGASKDTLLRHLRLLKADKRLYQVGVAHRTKWSISPPPKPKGKRDPIEQVPSIWAYANRIAVMMTA